MPDPAVYVHVDDDGGLLLIDASTGRSMWVTEAEIIRRAADAGNEDAPVLMSGNGNTPIARAVIAGITARATVVRTPNIHPDAVRSGGLTSLMSAAYVGAIELVEDLVGRGADAAAQDDDGFTALMYAVNGRHVTVVRLLIDAGVDVDQVDQEGSTALMFAVQHDDVRTVRRLLAAGADPVHRRVVDGLSASDFAATHGHSRSQSVLAAALRSEP